MTQPYKVDSSYTTNSNIFYERLAKSEISVVPAQHCQLFSIFSFVNIVPYTKVVFEVSKSLQAGNHITRIIVNLRQDCIAYSVGYFAIEYRNSKRKVENYHSHGNVAKHIQNLVFTNLLSKYYNIFNRIQHAENYTVLFFYIITIIMIKIRYISKDKNGYKYIITIIIPVYK